MNRVEARRYRQRVILDRIREGNGHLSVTELAAELDASRTTIYNDLDALKRAGQIAQEGGRLVVLEANGQRGGDGLVETG